jgi:hypothetical protein
MAVLFPGPKPPKAPTPGATPGLIEFYHGTTRANADKLVGETIGVYSVATPRLLDDSEYTDFGKGFYIHPPENRKLAIDWAKNHASKTGGEWGVLVIRLTQAEFDGIGGQILHFRTKRDDRPHNAPVLGAGRVQRREALRLASHVSPLLIPGFIVGEAVASALDERCNWIEFVEFNRHVHQSIARPKDNDWTADYGLIRGPIWVQKDSGLPGKLKPFPEHVHQIDLGIEGLKTINDGTAKSRRYVIHKDNENAPPP